MEENNKVTFRTSDFNVDEFNQIIERSKELIKRGYFSGINFLQSDKVLPQTSIMVHFLHDSERHIQGIVPYINVEHIVVPRFTFYSIRLEYVNKPNFREEYSSAIFFDSEFKVITIDEAIKNPYNITVSAKELDLVIPLSDEISLSDLVDNIRKADRKGVEAWIDPVIIIKTKTPLNVLKQFVDKYFVSLAKEKEEFYSVLTDKARVESLERYLDNLCKRTQIGRLRRSDIVFSPCHINQEFMRYLTIIQNQLDNI